MRKRQILHHSYGMNDTMYERYKAANNESYWMKTTDNRILYEDYISFLQSRHSSMEGIARHSYRQNLRWDSDWIDFMMFGIWLLQELLHWLLYSYWCVILLRSHTDSLQWRGKDMNLHLNSQNNLLDYYHELLESLFARTRAETQTVCYAALRLQGWSIARQEPIAASATYRFRDGTQLGPPIEEGKDYLPPHHGSP